MACGHQRRALISVDGYDQLIITL